MSEPRPVAGQDHPPAAADLDAMAGGTTVVEAVPARVRTVAARHYLWIVAAVVVLVLSLHWLGRVLTPFLVGAILAYLGTPLVDALERRGVIRALGAVLTVVLFALGLTALFFVLVPLAQAEALAAARRIPDLLDQAAQKVVPWVEKYVGIKLAFDVATVRSVVIEHLDSVREVGMRILYGVRSGGALLLTIVVNLALIPVVMFYLLRDWNMIVARADELLPRRWQSKVRTIARDVDAVLSEFLRGQLSLMVALAAYYVIGLSIAELEHAFAIGMLTGLLVFIPYVGYGLGLTLGITAALLQWTGWPSFLAVAAVYAVGQLLENYVLLPWLVGDRIGLHPLAVIFALLAFGALFGFAGVLLALPTSAVLLVGLRHLRAAYVASPIYRD
jgi:predicted PurR-regulated permease PerM